MRFHQNWTILGLVLFALIASSAFADQSNRFVRLRYLEGEVLLYPADGQRPSDASINSPLIDGDEIETGNGRAELTFRNGIVVRIGDYSQVRLESAYSPMIISLGRGTIFVDSHLIDSFGEELEVRAGDAQVFLINEGNLRIDLGDRGGVRVTTIDGEAEVRANGMRVLLETGERTYVDPGYAPESPQLYSQTYDELDDWNSERMGAYARREYGGESYVHNDIYYDSYELDQYGDWRYYGEYGNVWVPQVYAGWRPYYDGRWVYTRGGWFWVSYEPWGWAPYHYGRWGWSLDIGWYWIPGSVFAPAWVSFYDYGDYFGWCPLNYYGRPVVGYDYGYVPAVQKQKTPNITDAWTFVKKQDVGSADIRKITVPPGEVGRIKLDSTRITRVPKNEVTSYVIPKTQTTQGFVNDKRVIKRTGDIENPIGSTHREEVRSLPRYDPKSTTGRDNVVPRSDGTGAKGKDWEAERKPTGKQPLGPPVRVWDTNPGEGKPVPRTVPGKQSYDMGSRSGDREWGQKTVTGKPGVKLENKDDQFERRSIRPLEPGESLNYRYGDSGRDVDQKGLPWFRDPKSYDEPREHGISPRYMEEAKKIFERLDKGSSSTDASPRYEPKSRDSGKSYEHAPSRSVEVNKPSYGSSSSNRSSSGRSSGTSKSSSSSAKSKDKN